MFRWLHWIGVLFILISAILLLVTSVSAPVAGEIAMLQVDLVSRVNIRRQPSIHFGAFGYCIGNLPQASIRGDDDICTPRMVGYNPVLVMQQIDRRFYENTYNIDYLTRAFVLHPIACALAFLAAIAAFGGVIGSLISTAIGLLAWILTLVVLIIDFVVFGVLRRRVNDDYSGSQAYYGPAIWTTLAAFIFLLFGVAIVFVTCCTGRRKNRNKSRK